ncbi:MAG: hypothetical protein FWF84_04250 [Kiritimatiellaeota bacterium]|nr:hypothetical protein [Kiritimatiellota bacterium]
MKWYIIMVFTLLVNTAPGMDIYEFFRRYRDSVASVEVTSTNVSIWFKSNWFGTEQERLNPMTSRTSSDYMKNNEPMVLPYDKEACIFDNHVTIIFTPATFKGGLKGFMITEEHIPPPTHTHLASTNYVYVAMSDAPVDVGEDDMETIMAWGRGVQPLTFVGEWVTPEEYHAIKRREHEARERQFLQSVAADVMAGRVELDAEGLALIADFLPPPQPPPAIAEDDADTPPPDPEPPATVIARGVSAPKQPSARKWLYAIPALLLCAAVGLVIHWLAFNKK